MVEIIEIGAPFYCLPRPCVLGEGPIFRDSDNTLHYNDCLSNPPQIHILSVDPATGDAIVPGVEFTEASTAIANKTIPGLKVLDLEDSVTVQFFRKNHPKSYICAYYQGIAFLDEETGKLDVLKEIIPNDERHIRRFNDGAVDCKGRFWAAEIDVKGLAFGVGKLPTDYGTPLGRLWRYDPDGGLTQMEDGLVCGNGLAWSPDNTKMYLNDSVSQLTFVYDFDQETGSISNKKIFIDNRGKIGEPDGMVVDVEGNLWIAMYNGFAVNVYNPHGELIKQVKLDAKCLACTTWGGKDSDVIYVVSAYNKFDDRTPEDAGGHLFKFKTGVKGVSKYEFAG
ncbi:unnamed protein product [Kuraishia capsulata CBS 1993]|uniref:SMP-30/Gluconolactonase/LRE-like region domain-containing protein n=1 Tax=Kuraishia capsulata CBS 1993 TaxID=1382522 RepID=W6MKL1_9ASCO|nr:uncharacterized protein KUCA_T00002500001 [Kuraishia capsulata CBS 1993]CDK26528.1 unnamed protein product [Kuraishia capsulata CBS 1993]